jgi:hypothetical protein
LEGDDGDAVVKSVLRIVAENEDLRRSLAEKLLAAEDEYAFSRAFVNVELEAKTEGVEDPELIRKA